MEERLVLEAPAESWRRTIAPDVSITERETPGWIGGGGGTTTLEQTETETMSWVELKSEPLTESWLEIRESTGGRVITVIEFLSPSNKLPGRDRDLYLLKMEELLAAGVSTVEVDLLRQGGMALEYAQQHRTPRGQSLYAACVRRPWIPYKGQLWNISLNRPLPAIAIPLRQGETEVTLDLQSVFEQCYENGAYGDTDYSAELAPPLSPETKQWLAGLLESRTGNA